VVFAQQFAQQGNKLAGNDATNAAHQGNSVALSADGNTLVSGGPLDNNQIGATWVFTRSNGTWSQQGLKLVANDSVPTNQGVGQGAQVAVSADGNTLITGGFLDNGNSGADWVFVRNNGQWTQQGPKLVGSGNSGSLQGSNGISADGNTGIVGGSNDNGGLGAAWIFGRSNGVWNEQGPKLVASDTVTSFSCPSHQGVSVAMSGDGNTALVGGTGDSGCMGAAWVYTRSGTTWTEQAKLAGTGSLSASPAQGDTQGVSVALSFDGNTAAVAALNDNGGQGAVWIFTRSGAQWTQQAKLVGSNINGSNNPSVPNTLIARLSADGNTVIFGRSWDSNSLGAAWVFKRVNGNWIQQGDKFTGSGAVSTGGAPLEGRGVALSGDASTAALGGPGDNGGVGAAWVLVQNVANHFSISAPAMAIAGSAFNFTVTALDPNNSPATGYSGTVHFTSSDPAAALPADATLASGVGMFPVTLHTAGTQTITATDSAVSSLTGTSGAITVTAAAGVPGAGGDSVGSGSGSSTTMAFTFSDSAGFLNLHVVDVLINNALDGRHACYIAFVPSGANSGALDLVDDAGDAGGPYSGTTLPGSGTVANSQCTVSGSASGSGNTLTLSLNITFSAGFAGDKVIYLSAGDQSGANSNWQALGTWNVPGTAPSGPSVTGMSPARTSSLGPTVYTFTFADTGGFQDANSVENILVNSAIDGRHACFLAFVLSSNSVLLVDDAGDAAGPYQGLVLPSSGSISNSQCTINGAGSSVSRSGNTLTLTLSMTFSQGFAGNQVFYLAARNSTENSNWQEAGSVSVPQEIYGRSHVGRRKRLPHQAVRALRA